MARGCEFTRRPSTQTKVMLFSQPFLQVLRQFLKLDHNLLKAVFQIHWLLETQYLVLKSDRVIK